MERAARAFLAACVLAVSGAALAQADTTPPIAGTVRDGPGMSDSDDQASSTMIEANWSGFQDPESGIAGYEWAIGTSPGATDVQDFRPVGVQHDAVNDALSLTAGATYYATVRATNGAGLSVTATSDGIVAVFGPEVPGTVNDGPGADIDTQTSTTTISANWSGFSVGPGVAYYRWGIGTRPDYDDVQRLTPVGLATSATNAGLSLTPGKAYYVYVVAHDGWYSHVTAVSNGVIVTLPDATPPVAGTVNDGPDLDMDVFGAGYLSANWNGFQDPESGIARYEWAIGTSPGATDVQAFTTVGTQTSANASISSTAGSTLYVTVRATSGGGLTATATSDGVAVVPPELTVSPASLEFPHVAVGSRSDALQITVQNETPYDLWLSITSDRPDFVWTVSRPHLLPGHTSLINVSFQPQVTMVRQGKLTLAFSHTAWLDPKPPTWTIERYVEVKGYGAPGPPEEPPALGGCGCVSGGGTPVVAALLGLAAAWRRRRRRS